MRLIDADALLEEVPVVEKDKKISLIGAVADMIVLISNAPAIDAVPVVRCVDCKYRCTMVCPMYHTETCLDDLDGFDDYDVDRTDDDGFCHLGERRDGEENAAD